MILLGASVRLVEPDASGGQELGAEDDSGGRLEQEDGLGEQNLR